MREGQSVLLNLLIRGAEDAFEVIVADCGARCLEIGVVRGWSRILLTLTRLSGAELA
jgi:hypothetical protein